MEKKKFLKSLMMVISVSLTATILAWSAPTQSAEQPHVKTWKIQSVYPIQVNPPWKPETYQVQTWAKWVQDMSGGRLKIEILPAGTVVGAGEVFNAVSKGVLDGAFHYGGFWEGILGPITNVEIGLPLVWTNPSECWDGIYNYGLDDIFKAVYAKHNIYWMSVIGGMTYHFGTTFPISGIKDIKGKKIRAVGPYADYVKKLGGTPTIVAPAETYMALKLGTIDGVIYGMGTLETQGLREVIKYYVVEPNLNVISMQLLLNKGSFEALPDDIKENIKKWSRYILSGGAPFEHVIECKKMEPRLEKYGVTLVHFSQKDTDRIAEISAEIIQDVKKKGKAAGDEYTIKATDIIEKQMKDYGRFK
jgi:TRAP-type C4-dicarboxylate transport system substrate-binding protein